MAILAVTWEPVAHPKQTTPFTAFSRGAWPLPSGYALIDQVRNASGP
ncbi:hypothetical protein [Nonomuraea sp. NPDC050786]